MQFTAGQQAAIDAQNQNILIYAAAGSGKTTVMVEKIKQTLISHPEASISQFLVITFTKDAAQNMKDKLRTLLEDASQEGMEAAAKALGEIETALSAVPGIRRGCCLYEHKTQKIVAIYEGNLDQKALTEALKEKLPNYMLPNRYVPLEEMPINLNGKIDRTLLKHQYIKEN